MMDKKQFSKRLKAIVQDIQQVIDELSEPELAYLTDEIVKDVARKKKQNLCFYCSESLEGHPPKDVIRHVHRKCYRKITESSQSMEFHVSAGLIDEVSASGRKPGKDKAAELAEQLGNSVAQALAAKKKKPKP